MYVSAGLPDGTYIIIPKMPTLDILEGLEMEQFGIYVPDNLVNFIAAFKFFVAILEHFSHLVC
jgi:hypothetical protein